MSPKIDWATAPDIDFSEYTPTTLFVSQDFSGGWEPTMADAVYNYDFVIVEYCYNRPGSLWQTSSVTRFDPNGAILSLPAIANDTGAATMTLATARIVLIGDKLQYVDSMGLALTSSGTVAGFSTANQVVIHRVTGFKKNDHTDVVKKPAA